MTRLASRLVRGGEIGALRLVQVEYIQGGLAAKIEDGPQTTRIRWLFDPSRSGLAQVMSAIGCHAQHLACFVTGRGRHARRRRGRHRRAGPPRHRITCRPWWNSRAASKARSPRSRRPPAPRTTSGCASTANGAWWTGRTATAAICGCRCTGSRRASSAAATRGLPPEILRAGRSPRGHPEGLLQAFANIYGEVAQERMALALGDERPAFVYPRIEDGVAHHGVHRGLPGVARSRRLGGRRAIGSTYGVV